MPSTRLLGIVGWYDIYQMLICYEYVMVEEDWASLWIVGHTQRRVHGGSDHGQQEALRCTLDIDLEPLNDCSGSSFA